MLPALAGADSLREHTLAACLYPFGRHPFHQLLDIVRQLSYDRQAEILDAYAGQRRTRRDRPGRALEYGYPLTFDITADFGAYRDLQRHRMLSQERQLLEPALGYDIPEELGIIGMKQKIVECFEKSDELYAKMKRQFSPEIAQYAVLFGYKIRWMMGMNFREAMHMIELRTTPQGHPSYRHVCQKMMAALETQFPDLASTIKFADRNEYYWSRSESEARQRRKERELDDRFGNGQ